MRRGRRMEMNGGHERERVSGPRARGFWPPGDEGMSQPRARTKKCRHRCTTVGRCAAASAAHRGVGAARKRENGAQRPARRAGEQPRRALCAGAPTTAATPAPAPAAPARPCHTPRPQRHPASDTTHRRLCTQHLRGTPWTRACGARWASAGCATRSALDRRMRTGPSAASRPSARAGCRESWLRDWGRGLGANGSAKGQ
jgi:hypothetical protein